MGIIILVICFLLSLLRIFSINNFLENFRNDYGYKYKKVLAVSWVLNFIFTFLIGGFFYCLIIFDDKIALINDEYEKIETEIENFKTPNLYLIGKEYYYYSSNKLIKFDKEKHAKIREDLYKQLPKIKNKLNIYFPIFVFLNVLLFALIIIYLVVDLITPWVGGYYKEKFRIESIINNYQNSFNNIINYKL